MPQEYTKYKPGNINEFRAKALAYTSRFQRVFHSNSNNISFPFEPFEDLLAFDSVDDVRFTDEGNFDELKNHVNNNKSWLFGHISYDLKNQIEDLTSNHKGHIAFPEIAFFEPRNLLKFHHDHVELVLTDNPHSLIEEINKIKPAPSQPTSANHIICDTREEEYIEVVKQLKNHILQGDIYEINYCIEFLVKNIRLKPVDFFRELTQLSPSPFSLFYRHNSQFLLGASPERFIKKFGNQLISQPIKGTARRGNTFEEDESMKTHLRSSEKELAENMMIVDLVRNDLARSCIPGTVIVKEMFGIYTFKHLHQMISTISGDLRPEVHYIDAIKHCFPMGSMTGAPKIKVMELIEKYEKSKRGLYSGTVGYFTPEGNFDFNVVIRSLLYNDQEQIASFHVGSAITYDSNPKQEYNECMLKASAIKTLLTGP